MTGSVESAEDLARRAELLRALSWLVLGLLLGGCPRVRDGTGSALRTARPPLCDGAVLPWTADARRDVGALIGYGLTDAFGTTPLGLAGFEAPVFVIVRPAEIEVRVPAGLKRLPDVPLPPPVVETHYWKIEVGTRHEDGALLVREQESVGTDGRVASAVGVACAAFVDGKPVLVSLGGIAE